MCIPLVAQVVSVEEHVASVELLEGEVVKVNPALHPQVQAGEYVLLDRGLIVEIIDAQQAQEMLSFYTELEQLWVTEDATQ